MTILLDSSVLIQAQRQPDSETATHLAALLASGEAAVTGPVVMEFIRGARNLEEVDFLTRRVLSLDFLTMDQAVWILAGRLGNRFLRTGARLPNVDLSIAATAIRHGVPLYTLDRAFSTVPELSLYSPSVN